MLLKLYKKTLQHNKYILLVPFVGIAVQFLVAELSFRQTFSLE